MKTNHEYLIAIRVRTTKPIPAIADMVAGRAETIDGVEGPAEVLSFLKVIAPEDTIQVVFTTPGT